MIVKCSGHGDVPDLALKAVREREARYLSDIIDMGAVEHLAPLDVPARFATSQIDERIASRTIDAGKPQDVRFSPSRLGRRRQRLLHLFVGRGRVLLHHVPGRGVDHCVQTHVTPLTHGSDLGVEVVAVPEA